MNKNKKIILVTGATGFIGANLVRKLVEEKNYEIHIILRKTSNIWRIKDIISRLNKHYFDLNDIFSTKNLLKEIRPHLIYHCATYGGFPTENNLQKIITTNIFCTINFINCCLEYNFDAFVNVSSSSEYGLKNYPMVEDDQLTPITDYGVSKVASTIYATNIGRIYKKPIITVRLFSPFGYYEEKTRLFPSLLLNLLDNQNPQLGNPHSARDFIFIEDAVDGLVSFSNRAKEFCGGVFNLSCGRQYSVQDVADTAIKLSGKELVPKYLSVVPRIYDSNIWVANMNKTFNNFDWRPKHSLEESLIKLFVWFEKNKELYS